MQNKKIFVICEYKKNQNVFRDVSFELLGAANTLSEQAKREYIVEPVFKPEGEASLFSLLLNLMRLDTMG